VEDGDLAGALAVIRAAITFPRDPMVRCSRGATTIDSLRQLGTLHYYSMKDMHGEFVNS